MSFGAIGACLKLLVSALKASSLATPGDEGYNPPIDGRNKRKCFSRAMGNA